MAVKPMTIAKILIGKLIIHVRYIYMHNKITAKSLPKALSNFQNFNSFTENRHCCMNTTTHFGSEVEILPFLRLRSTNVNLDKTRAYRSIDLTGIWGGEPSGRILTTMLINTVAISVHCTQWKYGQNHGKRNQSAKSINFLKGNRRRWAQYLNNWK